MTACSLAGPSVFPGCLDTSTINLAHADPALSDCVIGDSTSDPDVTDFDRFFLLSDQRGVSASTIWTKVFGSHWNAPWTPLAKSSIESALFNFCERRLISAQSPAGTDTLADSRESVKASVSFDDSSNPFREVSQSRRIRSRLTPPGVAPARSVRANRLSWGPRRSQCALGEPAQLSQNPWRDTGCG